MKPSVNTPELEAHIASFNNVLLEIETHFRPLSEADFNWRVSLSSWSVGQCLEHLNLSNTMFLTAIEGMIPKTRATNLPPKNPYRRSFLGDWFLKNSEPPVKLKIKTRGDMVAPANLNQQAVLENFAKIQARLLEAARASLDLDLGAVSQRLAGPVVLTLGQYLALAAVHERRHIWQANQVLKALQARN